MKIDKPQLFILRKKTANLNPFPDWLTYDEYGNLLIDVSKLPEPLPTGIIKPSNIQPHNPWLYPPSHNPIDHIYDAWQPTWIGDRLPTTGDPIEYNQTLTSPFFNLKNLTLTPADSSLTISFYDKIN